MSDAIPIKIERVETIDDPRLDAYARLTDAQMRSRIEPERAILVAESENVIRRALEGGLEPISMLTCDSRLRVVEKLAQDMACAFPDIQEFVLSDDQFASLTGFKLTRGALAVFRRPLPLQVKDVIDGAHRICVIEGITNYTNVGAIFRSAAALGVDAVIVDGNCCDPYYRRAARVSMGTVFQVPWARIGSDDAGTVDGGVVPAGETVSAGGTASVGGAVPAVRLLQDEGFLCLALALRDDAVVLGERDFHSASKVACVLGTEGEGLTQATIDACDMAVRIPMHNGVDSLNVAAASAVAFWEVRKAREARGI